MELLIHKKLAMKLIFYLMAVDDIYSQQEWEQFNAMGKALDPSFNSYREELIRIASEQVKRMKNVSRNIYTAIQACVDSSISNGTASASIISLKFQLSVIPDSHISGKLFIWNMLTFAFANNGYTKSNRKLILHIIQKLKLDESIFLELEMAIQAQYALLAEKEWLHNSDMPYMLTFEPLNEIQRRMNTIQKGIDALVR